jgi:ubiquitin carboxyl-terminal hydrolase 4/11/15
MEVEFNENGGYDNDNSAMCATKVSGRKRLASGLSNMGNTCFMNSTLQCLAHTENLRRYFLSGEYTKDLNRDNPLGTGGELATQFASLMGEMWVDNSNRRNVMGETQNWKYSNPLSNAVYPRSFKNSLGKHAEQFMGYDQHDSQELATYLLDALHEDTNRVTKKPYVEKPEQGENESDTDAADTAWKMHLQREDSRVLENFMGQVKSRLECSEEECDRVSTTFDPFMYLSVPIPGETERTMHITFVPIDPNKKMQKLDLTLEKTATVADLLQRMAEELVKTGICAQPIPLQDLSPVEIYDKEIFKWHELDNYIDGIKDFDKTFVYELQSLEEVKKSYEEDQGISTVAHDWGTSRKNRIELDSSSRTELDKGDRWKGELERFSKNRLLIYRILNANRSSSEEKMEFYSKLEGFLNECCLELEKDESSRLKRTRDGTANADGEIVEMNNSASTFFENSEDATEGSDDRPSMPFSNVKTRHDVAVLEFCANKLRQFIAELMLRETEKNSEGIVIQVGIKQSSGSSTKYTSRSGLLSTCLVLRLARNSSVYSLREELARRLSRSLSQDKEPEDLVQRTKPEEFAGDASETKTDLDSSGINILRGTRLCYDNKDRGSNGNSSALGMLIEDSYSNRVENGLKLSFAMPSNEKEQVVVADRVKNRGRIFLYFEQNNDCKVFDGEEFDSVAVPEDGSAILTKEIKPDISVLDCIQNYCKKEQLEDSEMWYCNKCKKHVRAWKQFHLYRAPPILIIHLKRFFFSASTHRRDKITRQIDFPLEGLDLRDLLSSYEENEKPIYDCYAVSNHFGGLGGGHYTAYTLSDDGIWCNYDDSRVTTDIDPNEVVSEAAYVLYYRRRGLPVGEDRDLIVDTQISPMICEHDDVRGEASEVSSNNTALAGDMDLTLDDTDSNASSKTALSHMESIVNNDHNVPNRIEGFAEDRPLQ